MRLTDELAKMNKSNEGVFPESIEERKRFRHEANLQKLAPVLFDFNASIEDEPEVIFIGNTCVGSSSNISLYLGLRKAGKSTVIALLLGDQSGAFRILLPAGKEKILIADNEQSGKYIRKLQERIIALNGSQPSNLIFLRLRKYSKKERLEYIKLALDTYPDIGLVIIDNVRDICEDFNDPQAADRIATMLVQWAQNYNIHIKTVLHLNKGNGLSRGHLGSELENKAETVVKIRKDEQQNCVIVEPEATRGKPFEPLSFYFDETGMPVIQDANIIKQKAKSSKRNPDPWEFTVLTHGNLLDDAFKNVPSFGYEELWRAVKSAAAKHSIHLNDNTSKAWVTYYKQEKLVTQNEKKKYIKSEDEK